MTTTLFYPENPNRAPSSEDMDFLNAMLVDMIPGMFVSDIDETIKNLRQEYLTAKNDACLPATSAREKCLFRLFEAKYLILPHKKDLDLLAFAFDDDYYACAQTEAVSKYDQAYAKEEFEKAILLVHEKNYTEAAKHFENAALNGLASAQFDYAVALANGETSKTDELLAAFWYFMSAKAGYSKAMINLAIAYRRGSGVYPNRYLMLHWYSKAALLGDPHGVRNMGLVMKNQEVFSGYSSIGNDLITLANGLEDENVLNLVKTIANKLIELMAPYAINA